MVSLDERRKGDVLMLRKSMIKFKSSDWNIEICGSGLRPLPFYLNRPLIKILEDLGVPAQSFLDLQEEAIDRLRLTSQSPLLAAAFLEHANLARAARFPWLVRVLGGLGFHYSSDDFLRQTVELAVLVKLQEIKYRSRIEVEQGITLYGIMDETGILKEGEIYCPMETEANGREVLIRRNVTVTRSPALHPGDVQVVNAVDVPKDSPLNRLHNCIVFSQHGDRDLPSKLSGGDLDGDLYNVIYDPRLTPRLVTSPADYPRVQEVPLDRAVVKEDIVDFFIKFMQQDQLGRIATVHQSIADQQDLGTCDPDCILLSELHSNAVDFSKTGIPVRCSTRV